MKELSIEEKAKRYDDAIERARIWKDKSGMPKDKQGIIDDIFPELKKSEDERIRKALIELVRMVDKNPIHQIFGYGDIKYSDIITWLEKQGNKPQGKSALEAIKEEKVDNANKVEPKFRRGEWIACKGLNTARIINIYDDTYEVEFIDGNKGFPHINYVDKYFYIWTIQNAKDGDVLVDVYGNIGIYEKYDDFDWTAYCSLGRYGGFQDFKVEHGIEGTYPATKEQRDTLLKAMADAGYTFDFEKKELKEIEQKPVWSEEDDERNLNWVINVWNRLRREGDAQTTPHQMEYLENWLKSLRPLSTWKPSDEQMEALESATENCAYSEYQDCLRELIFQLKKLREE